jgi:uncharacterized protein YlxW (UPF0749 family)
MDPASQITMIPPAAAAEPADIGEAEPASANDTQPKRRRGRRVLVCLLIFILLGTTIAGSVVASHQNHVAHQWRNRDLAEVARNLALTKQLTTANSSIATLNGQVADLNDRIAALNNQIAALTSQNSALSGQIASVASQKEKPIDLLDAAGVVANRLQSCVSLDNTFYSDLSNAEAAGTLDIQYATLHAEASNADAICNSAQQANQQLQARISAYS